MSSLDPKLKYHRFLDEAGDTTFYGKGRVPVLGTQGVSKYFLLGMLTINEPIDSVRGKIIELQNDVIEDHYYFKIRSIQKKKLKSGYFFHATDDIPEVRKLVFEFINSIDCKFDAVVGKKDYKVYEKKHNGNQSEFYADMLSILLHDNLVLYDNLVLNIASRSRCTTQSNLDRGLQKALLISKNKYPNLNNNCKIAFNVQHPTIEPIINIADYFLWAVQRMMEREEDRYIDFIGNKINEITYLYQ